MKNIDPFAINIIEIQNFLIFEFKKGAAYGTINSYRSVLALIFGEEIAQDPGIKRICKGAAKLRPPKPKYDVTWNPKIVLDFLATWSPNEDISLEKLSYKLVVLLMLITSHRIQTLSLIDVREIKINENKIQIKITAPIKTSKPGKSQPMLNLPFYPNENVCVAKALTNYLYRTFVWICLKM